MWEPSPPSLRLKNPSIVGEFILENNRDNVPFQGCSATATRRRPTPQTNRFQTHLTEVGVDSSQDHPTGRRIVDRRDQQPRAGEEDPPNPRRMAEGEEADEEEVEDLHMDPLADPLVGRREEGETPYRGHLLNSLKATKQAARRRPF